MPVYLVTTGASAWIFQHFLISVAAFVVCRSCWIRFHTGCPSMGSKNKFITPILVLFYLACSHLVTPLLLLNYQALEIRVRDDLVNLQSHLGDFIVVILIYTLQRMKRPGISRIAWLRNRDLHSNDTENNTSIGIAQFLGRANIFIMVRVLR
ncbi:hypothetical protein L218DRAFT_128725 [Marasmius fiardii PR-910]|nr:hypothetical protein L218DRAFT_128725 [Marasmius fiardii PR-910]